MPFDAHVLNVLIASPGDTKGYRNLVERTLHNWNGDRARGASTILLPRRWETDSVPLLTGDAQGVINKQLVDQADIVVGVFHSRLGKATPRGPSGTAEEIERSADAGKPVHVYFADMPHPHDVDPEQLTALKSFRQEMEERGLFGSFSSEDDLRTKVRSAVEYDVSGMTLGVVSLPKAGRQADLVATFRDEQLIVANNGDVKAFEVQIRLDAGGGQSPQLVLPAQLPTIPPKGQYAYPCFPLGMADTVEIFFTWRDSEGEEHKDSHSLSLLD